MKSLTKSSEVYLDANFLVAYFTAPHSDHIKAKKLMANLAINKNQLVLSALAIDEMMNGIKNTLQQQESATDLKKGKSHKDYIADIRKAVDSIIGNSGFRITQFNNPDLGCMQAVDNIDSYILRPRDAFHLAYLQDQQIKYIVTNDSNFFSIAGISCVDF